MTCDIILAAESAKFGQPEIASGRISEGEGTQRLVQAIDKSKTMEMILTGYQIDAHQAEEAGLVSHVVPNAELFSEALKLAERIVPFSQPALAMAKETVNDNKNKNHKKATLSQAPVKGATERIQSLESRLIELENDLHDVKEELMNIKEKKEYEKKVLIVRQLAYSYQSKLAQYVNTPKSKLSRTHWQVHNTKSKDEVAWSEIETFFENAGYFDDLDVDNAIEKIREIGTNLGQPLTDLNGEIFSEDGMKEVIHELTENGILDRQHAMCALDCLAAIVFLSQSPRVREKTILHSLKQCNIPH